jgi:hypothetical protein
MCDTAGTFAPGKIYYCQAGPSSFLEDTYVFSYEAARRLLVKFFRYVLRGSLTHPPYNKPQTAKPHRISTSPPYSKDKRHAPCQA